MRVHACTSGDSPTSGNQMKYSVVGSFFNGEDAVILTDSQSHFEPNTFKRHWFLFQLLILREEHAKFQKRPRDLLGTTANQQLPRNRAHTFIRPSVQLPPPCAHNRQIVLILKWDLESFPSPKKKKKKRSTEVTK